MKRLLATLVLAGSVAVLSPTAHAALYTNSFGSDTGSPSNCDDCFSGPFSFGGGTSINFFGNNYSGLYVGSNGYVTFGAGASTFTTQPLNTQAFAPGIAGSFTDLDSRSDAPSNVWINALSPGQLIITWDQMGHFPTNYSVRSTFQLVVRADEFATPGDEGQIGFFYAGMTDPASTSAGFGDGLAAINPGEVAFLSAANGTLLNENAPRWFNLTDGTPVDPGQIPEPGTLALAGLALAGIGFMRRRRTN